MGVFSGHNFIAQYFVKRHGKSQDVYYQFYNSHLFFVYFSFCRFVRSANLKIQTVLNNFFSCKKNAFCQTLEKLEINTRDFLMTCHLFFILFAFEKGK